MGAKTQQAQRERGERELGSASNEGYRVKGERNRTKLWHGLRRQLDTYRRRYRENAWKENGCWVSLCEERQPTGESEVYYWTSSQRWSYLERVGVCLSKRLRV